MTKGKAKTVSGVKALGPHKVQITLDQPEAVILNQLAYVISSIVPRHVIEKYGKNWTESLFPGLVLTAMVLCFSFVGDGLRDALDPRTLR